MCSSPSFGGRKALPDEILVGIDIDAERPHRREVDAYFEGDEVHDRLFQGQGYVIKEAHIVNRGDSYSVHHLPEDWTDDMFSADRGSRAGRFTHWLHTHPNAPAIPSGPTMPMLLRKPRHRHDPRPPIFTRGAAAVV